jgi:hypothetical protein
MVILLKTVIQTGIKQNLSASGVTQFRRQARRVRFDFIRGAAQPPDGFFGAALGNDFFHGDWLLAEQRNKQLTHGGSNIVSEVSVGVIVEDRGVHVKLLEECLFDAMQYAPLQEINILSICDACDTQTV